MKNQLPTSVTFSGFVGKYISQNARLGPRLTQFQLFLMYPGKLGLFPERVSLAQRNFVYKNSIFIHFLMLERTSHEENPFIKLFEIWLKINFGIWHCVVPFLLISPPSHWSFSLLCSLHIWAGGLSVPQTLLLLSLPIAVLSSWKQTIIPLQLPLVFYISAHILFP